MAFCANCGAQVEGRFCQKCGAPVGGGAPMGGAPMGASAPSGTAPPEFQPQTASAGLSDNAAGAICYLFGFITGILFLVLAPYNQNRTVKFHAFQSIFLSLAWFVIWIGVTIVSIIFGHIPVLGAIVALLLGFCVWIGAIVIWLYMMFKTYNGEKIVLPIIGPMAEKQAGA
jgi:uncharacterized membrane protein